MEKLGYAEFKVGRPIKKWNNIWPGINEIEMTINTENKPVDV